MPAAPFFLVLTEVGDPVAGAVYEGLRRRGEPVEIVAGEELALARRWVHEVGNDGTRTRVELQDGRVLADGGVRAVFNRLRGTSVPQFARASEADQTYASSEMHALLTSWLASLRCPVANPACARGLSGAVRSSVEWAHRVARVGLPVRRRVLASRAGAVAARHLVPHRFPPATMPGDAPLPWSAEALVGDEPVVYLEQVATAGRTILIVGDEVLGAPVAEWEDPCRRLARDAGLVVLHVGAAQRKGSSGEWVVTEVDPHPMTLPAPAFAAIVGWMLAARSEDAS